MSEQQQVLERAGKLLAFGGANLTVEQIEAVKRELDEATSAADEPLPTAPLGGLSEQRVVPHLQRGDGGTCPFRSFSKSRDGIADRYCEHMTSIGKSLEAAAQKIAKIQQDPDLSDVGRAKALDGVVREQYGALRAEATRLDEFERKHVESVFAAPLKLADAYDKDKPWQWHFDSELVRQFASMPSRDRMSAVTAIASGNNSELRDALIRAPRQLSGVSDRQFEHVKRAAIKGHGGEPEVKRREAIAQARDAAHLYLKRAVLRLVELAPRIPRRERIEMLGGRAKYV